MKPYTVFLRVKSGAAVYAFLRINGGIHIYVSIVSVIVLSEDGNTNVMIIGSEDETCDAATAQQSPSIVQVVPTAAYLNANKSKKYEERITTNM